MPGQIWLANELVQSYPPMNPYTNYQVNPIRITAVIVLTDGRTDYTK